MKKIKPESELKQTKEKVDFIKSELKDCTNYEFEDGGIMQVKGGIKKKGKVLKLEIEYDKDFIEDNVHINIKAGCKEINLVSPEKSSGFTASFSATKSF